jgi:TRAP-type C4-dicarboxylate transport system permease small subunit
VVCRHCQCPLVGEYAQALRANLPRGQKVSNRWLVNALLVSIAYAVLLVLAFFLFTVIPNAMYSSETGWRDYTPQQWSKMKFWYLILVDGGVILIFLYFYSRRRKYHIEG